MHDLNISNKVIRLGEAEARLLLEKAWERPAHIASIPEQLEMLLKGPLSAFKVKGSRAEELVKQSGVDFEHVYIYGPRQPSEDISCLEKVLFAAFGIA
jgi:hypothetical protein